MLLSDHRNGKGLDRGRSGWQPRGCEEAMARKRREHTVGPGREARWEPDWCAGPASRGALSGAAGFGNLTESVGDGIVGHQPGKLDQHVPAAAERHVTGQGNRAGDRPIEHDLGAAM